MKPLDYQDVFDLASSLFQHRVAVQEVTINPDDSKTGFTAVWSIANALAFKRAWDAVLKQDNPELDKLDDIIRRIEYLGPFPDQPD